MSTVVARTGRHKQLYDGKFRLVSGCIPFRMTSDGDDPSSEGKNGIEVLMVSSPNRDDLVFPKGGWEDDESVREAACREALEEAGVRGILNEESLGMWEFWSKSRDACSQEGGCRGHMFAMRVIEELDFWPEQGNRSRKWLNVEEAYKLCRYDWMREALGEFIRVMANSTSHETTDAAQVVDQEASSSAQAQASQESSESSSDVVTERQIVSSNCCVQTSNGLSPIMGVLMAPGIYL